MSDKEVKSKEEKLTVQYDVNGQTVYLTPKIVQDYIVGTNSQITVQEYKFFTELCKARKLNPFLKEAYCIKYGDKPAQIVVGKDAILKRAVLNPKYDGMESGIIVTDEKGEVTERRGTFKLENEKLVGGWARVYRKDWNHPIYCSVSFDEVAQRKSDGKLNSNWSNKGATMVEKVAKVRALRETFVEDLGGMYEADEIEIEQNSGFDGEIIDQSEPIAEPVAESQVPVYESTFPEAEQVSINDL